LCTEHKYTYVLSLGLSQSIEIDILPLSEFYLLKFRDERVHWSSFDPQLVDQFYDLMEICYHCVFQQTINPSTRHPYVQNATISVQTYIPYKYYWKFEVHVSPAYHDGKPLLHNINS